MLLNVQHYINKCRICRQTKDKTSNGARIENDRDHTTKNQSFNITFNLMLSFTCIDFIFNKKKLQVTFSHCKLYQSIG